ncbi:MAG: family 16 glycoside hydrolase, partial [Ferruginibacter sp.]
GNRIPTWVNGLACAHLVDEMTPKGYFALQVHAISEAEDIGKEIRWRRIRVQTGQLLASPPDNIFVINTIPNNLSLPEKRSGMRLLWDGKTTAGWRGAYKTTFPEKVWYIENGTLNVKASTGAESANGGDIVTTEEFGAFDLQFEFKLTDTANSGVKYFVTEKENNQGSAIGLEYQVLDDDKHADAKLGSIGNRTTASLYDLIPSLKITEGRREKLPVGEWNRGRIVVYPDNQVEHWINGWKVVEYQRGTPYFYALVARSKYKDWVDFGMSPKGRILLQEHGSHVSFRSIKIRELK